MINQFVCGNNGDAFEVTRTVIAKAATPMVAANYSSGSNFWYEAFPGIGNDTGVRVNGYTALGNVHVWKALNVLAGDIGQLPVKLYKKVDGKSEEVENHPAINALRDGPNPWMNPGVWKETMMWAAPLFGNSASWVYMPNPNTIRLIPLRSDRLSIEVNDEMTGDFNFVYTDRNNNRIPIDYREVIHIPGLSCNGIWGLSLLDVAKNVIGQGLALEKYVNFSFKNGNKPSGVVKHPGKPSPEARANFRSEWDQIHQGVENSHKIALLAEGMDYVPFNVSMEASQTEELRKLDRQFVAELFGLPLFKLNSLENSSTRSNLEQQNQEYLQGSLMRWLNRFAEEFRRKLLTERERREGYYFRWITEALLRGDTPSRFSAYGVAIQNRIMNPNEVREKEDMAPYEGGDEYGNPNIDPKQSPDDAKAANDADNAGGRPPGSSSADSAIDRKLAEVVKAERNSVTRGAESENFIKWVDEYYGAAGGWWQLIEKSLKPLATLISEIIPGYPFDADGWAARHAAESKRLLLKMCDQTTQDRLVDAVKGECDTWQERGKRG